MTALRVDDVSVSFADLEALRDVSFSLDPGTVTGLIGPNGAGKTTLLDVISGFTPPTGGQVALDGRRIDGLPPHRRAALRLGRTFQSMELFDDMTVGENLRIAAESAGAAAPDTTRALGMDIADRRLAGEISHGERKRLALARALAGRPGVLLLDEPAAGLDVAERHELVALLRDIAADGVCVLLVDHDLGLVLEACDRVIVLDFGRVIADGDPDSVRTDPAVAAAYVGRHGGHAPPATRLQEPGALALSARNLRAGYGGPPVVAGVDLQVAAGEIVALLGPNGAGKTTTLLALSGALPDTHGHVEVLGRPLQPGAFRQARAGVAHVLQSRGVFTGLTTAENLRLADRRGRETAQVLDLLPALSEVLGKPAGRLSGGQQQMLALARALVSRPRLLLIDEMSLGLAPVVVTDLLETLARLATESGTAILLAEQHADLALSIASRAYVLVAGRIVDTAPSATLAADPQRLAGAYLGGGVGPTPLDHSVVSPAPLTHGDDAFDADRSHARHGRGRARGLRWWWR